MCLLQGHSKVLRVFSVECTATTEKKEPHLAQDSPFVALTQEDKRIDKIPAGTMPEILTKVFLEHREGKGREWRGREGMRS